MLDTSVLVNFLAVDRMDLLALHRARRFLVTEHVKCEVTADYTVQSARLAAAVQARVVEVVRVDAVTELQLFERLMGGRRLGAGECAAIAYAACRGHFLAIDDKAARRAAAPVIPHARLLDTQAVMVSLIAAGVLSIDEADAIRDEWERQHRFALRIRSFRDAL